MSCYALIHICRIHSEGFSVPGRNGGSPFHITTGMPDWVFYTAFMCVVIFSGIIWYAIKKDKRAGLTDKEREAEAIRFLLHSRNKEIPAPKKKKDAGL